MAARSSNTDKDSVLRRLVELRGILANADGLTASEIAERMQITERSAYRYLRALREGGEPLDEEIHGKRKLWRLGASTGRASISMTTSQMLALYLSKRTFDFLAGTGFKEDLDEVFAKLEAQLRRKDFAAVRHLERKLFAVNEAPHLYAEQIEQTNAIVTALLREERLEVVHGSARRGPRKLLIEPYTLLVYRKGLYLAGFSKDHGELRTFALDELRDVQWLRGDKFTYPVGYDPAALVEGAFGLIRAPDVTHVQIWFAEGAARRIRRRRWHPSQRITPAEGGGIVLAMDVHGTAEVEPWVVGFAGDARVLAPASLRERVRAAHAAGGEAHRGDRAPPRPAPGKQKRPARTKADASTRVAKPHK